MPRLITIFTVVVFALSPQLQASNCNGTSVNKIPLTDLGTGYYQGYQGGLYANGANTDSASHLSAGLHQAMQITKLNASGLQDPSGKIVIISIGMSNTTQEFSFFKPIADADSRKNPDLVIVDCAQGGQDAQIWAETNNRVWDVANQRLASAGVNPNQVQAVWIKQAIKQENKAFPNDAKELQGFLKSIVQNAKAKYPNLRLAYLSSRIYAGYATSTLSPEPYAYQSAFAVKWLIQEQVDGAADLNFDADKGSVRAPWIAWGPDLWADGINPRSDGLTYVCSDFNTNDGTHPAEGARQKVSDLLLNFFKTDKTAAPWFTRDAYAPATAGQSKLKTIGDAVALTDVAVTMGSGPLLGSIYVEEADRSSGIRVITNKSATEGGFVNSTGVMQTSSDGERYIDASSVISTPALPSMMFPEPLGMTNRAIGGAEDTRGQRGVLGGIGANNIGLLVRTWGRVVDLNPNGLYLSEGLFAPVAADVKIVIPNGVTAPVPGSFVVLTGISSCWQDGIGKLHRQIRLRKQSDVMLSFP